MSCFADDSTLVVARINAEENKELLKTTLNKVTEFLQSNELCINQDRQKHKIIWSNKRDIKITENPSSRNTRR